MARFRAFSSDTSSSEDEPETRKVPIESPTKSTHKAPDGSDDDDNESEKENESGNEQASSSGGSSSEMHEDELDSSPIRKRGKSKAKDRNALVQDEDGEVRYAHEVNSRVSTHGTPSKSPPARPRQPKRGDPTIIPWAQHVGVDPQRMHVMQSALFRTPEDAVALRALKSKRNQPPQRTSAKALNLGSNDNDRALNRKHSRDEEGDGLRPDSRERLSFAQQVETPTFRPSRKYARVGFTSSIAYGNEGARFDAGLAMGSSFRVGWGPAGQLVHVGSICSPMSITHTSSNTSTITITKTLPTLISSRPDSSTLPSQPSVPALATKLLQHHLTHTTISPDESGAPCAIPTSSTLSASTSTRSRTHAPAASPDPLNFSSFASLFPTNDTTSPAPIFRLGSALFDPIDLQLGRSKKNSGIISPSAITPDLRNRVLVLRRKNALSKWLKDVVKPGVDADLRMQTNGSNASYTPADAAFTHLTGHQINEACTTAADGGYFKLATLLSQAGGDDLFKEDILSQIDIWKREKLVPGSTATSNGGVGLVSRGIWKIYNLLGGVIHQGETDGSQSEDVCTGLDWKRVFGLFLWYGTSVNASIADVVHAYENILLQISNGPSTIAKPIPKWAASLAKQGLPLPLGSARSSLFSGSSSSATDNLPEDPLYVLIKLFSNPALSLSKALNPLSFTPSGLDWGIGMCWHLYIILSRVMRVRDFSDRTDLARTQQKGQKGKSALSNGRSHVDSSDGSTRDDDDDDFQPEGHSPSADLLTSAYAFELESWGLVQEASFVLLHLEGSVGREKAIKDLLARSAPKLDDWMTRALVGSLKLPMTWVDEAKAMYEYDSGKFYSAYEFYISAECYNTAHDLALLELAPDAIIRKDWELLGRLFSPFNSAGRRDKIDGWFVKGQVLLDYVEIMTKLPKLLDEVASENEERATVPDAAQAADIDRLSKRAPKIIALLPDIFHRSRTVDPRHVATLEEMSKDLLKLIERAEPMLLSRIQEPTLNVLDSATKIDLVRGIGYARFLQSIEA
ncbi:Nuclear pore complex protein Nup98-Nup96 [Psilocybe cubensis]|uniref:Nuclear pore complex protein NUP96 C-terminal domain-containing protein n=2 Tax=Psilocybe cubensis TaxID=181762 RepID=A0A8H7XZ11_PSICU|nr:Nuclear pore complex protein Nup98-Nup96 [Psilocybe cubensis]KAH9478612.1 Nuclear pore complex protein Nup98-Nup96 [Psilocybe cubensis]